MGNKEEGNKGMKCNWNGRKKQKETKKDEKRKQLEIIEKKKRRNQEMKTKEWSKWNLEDKEELKMWKYKKELCVFKGGKETKK